MGRAPCCEKMGVKKGPWTPQEDQVLVSYIQKHGHGNWRALPKHAGLLRCGKSCRLRWTNYLRPDIKRGNFTQEEEETIIKLHEMLGNRWSAIASRLPGRTDNEIKNVWHTHLKKRLKNYQTSQETKRHSTVNVQKSEPKATTKVDNNNQVDKSNLSSGIHGNVNCAPVSPQRSSSEISTVTDSAAMEGNIFIKQEEMDSLEYIAQIDESFWSEDLSADSGNIAQEDQFHHGVTTNYVQFQLPLSTMAASTHEDVNGDTANLDDGMDFWYDLFIRAADLPELPAF